MLKPVFKRFARDRRATIAIITAIFIFPLMFLGVGVPIDLARAIQYRANLQNIADGAALAGSEALGIGATPAQACNLTLAYINVPIANGELPAATLSATLTAPGGGVSICNGASGLSTPQTTQATAPNLVNVTISGSQPTTFLSIYKPSMPVSVASSAIGPQGFITICASPAPNPSGDLSQVYYYLRNSNGSLVNEDNSPVNPSSADTLPGASGGVSLLAFLGDDDYLHENPPLATNGYCNASHTEVAVLVKAGLAQRLGFAYYVVSNAQTPCIADPNFKANSGAAYWTSFSCLQGDVNYAYDPYNAATNIGGFFDYYQTYALPAYKNYLLPNAYGSPVGWVNAFYSTDYPASLNSNNLEAGYSGTGNPASPVAGDSCFTTYSNGTTVASVANGFTAASQSCILNESVNTPNLALTAIFYPTNKTPTKAPNITPASGGSSNTNVVFWANWYQLQAYGGSTSTGTDLVCLASNGASYTPTITTYNRGTTKQYSVATFPKTANVQQENFIIANSSVAPNVYHCPVNTVGSPYYPDPTCAELNGATLQIAWNDMGGVLYDNGNYVDLVYSYSCKPPAATDTINSAIIQ